MIHTFGKEGDAKKGPSLVGQPTPSSQPRRRYDIPIVSAVLLVDLTCCSIAKMANAFRLLPATVAVLFGFFLSSAVGVTILSDDADDGFYREDPSVSSSTTPEPTYPDGVNTIPGDAGIHYPIYERIFKTSFSCSGNLAGFYADIEARCQIWHICDVDGRMQSFLCTNGTIFSQQTRVCEWWYNANCDANYVKRNYKHNKELYQTFQETELSPEGIRNPKEGKSLPVPPPPARSPQPIPKAILRQAPIAPTFSTQLTPSPKAAPVGQFTRPPPFRDFSQTDADGQPKKIEESLGFGNGVQLNPRPLQQSRPVEEGARQQQRQKTEARRPQPVDEARQAEQQRPTREQLEQRRQAARDEFYSIPAKIEQEKRISQQRFQEQKRTEEYRSKSPSPPQPTIPSSNTDKFHAYIETRRPETATPATRPAQTDHQAGNTPKQKFRHSTQRKHNVSFRPTPQFQQDNSDDEKQIPEETQQNGFPFYNRRFFSRKGLHAIDEGFIDEEGFIGRKFPDAVPTEYVNPYLPTSNEPIDVRTTAADIQPPPETTPTTTMMTPKRRTRKRRLRPTKKQNPESERVIPLPVLSYKPPRIENPMLPTKTIKSPDHPIRSEQVSRIESLESSKIPKRPKNAPNGARVVVKRKFRDNFGKTKELDDGNNRNNFPGNPHLEQKVDSAFRESHAAQKRCAVVGTGNTFKVLC